MQAGYRRRTVLRGVTLAVRPGELVAVVGPNGSGKSTLVRVLAGTLAVEHGSVRLDGADLGAMTRRAIARRIAVVPQESEVAFGFSVREVVEMGRAPYQTGLLLASAEDRRAVDSAIERCELGSVTDRPVAELSGGERRRVAVARALAQTADVLLLDEPAAHLDLRHAAAIHETARREARERGAACLAVMHDLNAAARWADRVVVLAEGHLRADGSVAEALDPALLAEVFGVAVRARTDPEDGSRWFVAGPR